MTLYAQLIDMVAPANTNTSPIMICLLGDFQLLKQGEAVPIRAGGKTELLLAHLGLQYGRRVPRERLVNALWPASDLALGSNSLRNLVHHLHKNLDLNPGISPVLHEDGYYRLNVEAGIGVDVASFNQQIEAGDKQVQMGNEEVALLFYRQAAELYRDDLCMAADSPILMVERERLRGRYLTLLAKIAESAYKAGNYDLALEYLWRLLSREPCQEDAHRLVMRCYVKSGARVAALRQYQVCANLLRGEFDTTPEDATANLYELIRDKPALV
jgi:DNA-binding SARP family transcriptional activator